MKRIVLLLSCLCLTLALFTACGRNNDYDGRPEMKMRNYNNDNLPLRKQDVPLRNDPEYNDRDNRVFDSDRDDLFIDDEDIKLPPRVTPKATPRMTPNNTYNR
ncbi:hypothetical protein [Paenibacillus montanisoli]|uniref:Lipoprotein n=1 Tax=Paenibacillus montanisoli TaxID=2081970 RepID=A0A328TZ43_9BACL|nr:hypothetical protein [Paenibacillus montanisoli]RAP75797.1 hypothetical protein DL346_10150 [Paenibacillus montanisoli]